MRIGHVTEAFNKCTRNLSAKLSEMGIDKVPAHLWLLKMSNYNFKNKELEIAIIKF